MKLSGYSGIEFLSFLSLLNLVSQLTDACAVSFSVAVGSAFIKPMSATMTLTVKMAVMNVLAVR